MLLIQTAKGESLRFNLQDEDDLARWNEFANNSNGEISTVGIIHRKETHAIPIPRGFRKVYVEAELLISENGTQKAIGERVSIKADDIRTTMIVHYHHRKKWTSILVVKEGRQVFKAGGRRQNG